MIGTRETAAAQTAGGHVEVTAIFLNHDIRCNFRSAEQGMLALIDGEIFWNPVRKSRIVILKTRVELAQRDPIGPISINLVGRHMNERRFGTRSPGRFEQ